MRVAGRGRELRRAAAVGLAVVLMSVTLSACGSAPGKAPGTASVVSAPARIAHTRLGAIGYRVVMFDNSGVGRTQELPPPLTVDAMADQTSALIDTLGLGRPDVLGWSMGGMIAQAL